MNIAYPRKDSITRPKLTRWCLFLFCCLLGLGTLQAQNKVKQKDADQAKEKKQQNNSNASNYRGSNYEKSKTYQGTGRDLVQRVRRIKTKKDLGDDASMRASFISNQKFVDPSRQRAKNSLKSSSYAGNISARKQRIRQRRNRDKEKEIAAFSGNIRYVNTAKQRAKKSRKIASFMGANPIRVRKKPRGALVSSYRGAPNRNRKVASYDRGKLKSGRKVKRSELPNYQKVKPTKKKYDSRETKMWLDGGDTLPKRADRELPKTKKKKRKKKAENEAPEEEGQEY